MPQTSPMNWMIISLSMIALSLTFMSKLTNQNFMTNQKLIKKMNLLKKWMW